MIIELRILSPVRALLFACLMLMASFVQAQTLQSYVDRTTVAANETVNFTVSVDRQVDVNSVDFSALYDDFRVFGISPRSQTQIVDGQMSATTTWVIPLMPKLTGQLTIPVIEVAGKSTRPITLTVTQAPQSISTGAEIEVQVEADRSEAHVNEQIIVTVRLIVPNQASDLRGEEFIISGAESTLLEQQQFRRVNEGIAFQVVEWQYAVFATDVGSLTIPSQVFSVVVNDNSQRRFDPFANQVRRVIGNSEELEVEVLAPPADSTVDWFPARDVQVSSSWQNVSNTFRVGEPVTRSIVVASIGQKPEVIPPLVVANNSDFKIYADQPQLSEDTSSLGVVGTRTESIAMVPNAAGELLLPAVVVRWWDIDQRRWKESELPEETIIVEPPGLSAPPIAAVAGETLPESQISALVESGDTLVPEWLPGLSIALGLGLLLVLLQNFRLRRQLASQDSGEAPKSVNSNEQEAWRKLRKALKLRQPEAVRSAILAWGREFWHEEPRITLEFIGQQGRESGIQNLLAALDRRIYMPEEKADVDYNEVSGALTELRRSARSGVVAKQALPGLYLVDESR